MTAPADAAAPPSSGPRRFRVAAAVIDLDGTLLDTAPDLVSAANQLRADEGLGPLSYETIVSFVGKGSEKLVHRTLTGRFDGVLEPDALVVSHARFLRRYAECNGREARLYPSVLDGLQTMRANGVRLACVTNKPAALTLPLLEQMGLTDFFEFVFSGDSLPTRKPDPGPMLAACARFRLQPAQVLAIGDSINDAQAARAAGMPVVLVPYGYNEGADVRTVEADGIVATLSVAAGLIDPVVFRGSGTESTG